MKIFTQLMMKEKIPKGYKVLAWIESDGNQYIDTGRVPNNTDIIEQKFQTKNSGSSTVSWYGSMPSSSQTTPRITMGVYSQGLFVGVNLTFSYSNNITGIKHIKWQVTGEREVTYTLNGTTAVVTPVSSAGDTYSPQLTLTSYLFARHGDNGVQVSDGNGTRIYFHKEYLSNGKVVLDLVPCKRESDNELGMYDKVSGRFLTNLGTGKFVGSDEFPLTVVGSPTITDGVVSGFSANDYLKTTTRYTANNMNDNDYEFCVKFTPTSSMGNECYALKYYNSGVVRGLGINQNRLSWGVGYPNTSGHQEIITSDFEITIGQTYYLKGIYQNKIASLYYSTDGINYTLIGSVDETAQSFQITDGFNFGADGGVDYGVFGGSIDIENSYIKINGIKYIFTLP